MTKASYRKRPVEIEAIQLTEHNVQEVAEFVDVAHTEHDYTEDYHDTGLPAVFINTLEGVMVGNVGDYIIKGIKGEFYPCKEDIFLASYEAVAPAPAPMVAHLTLGELARIHDEALEQQENSWLAPEEDRAGYYAAPYHTNLPTLVAKYHPHLTFDQCIETASVIGFMGTVLEAYTAPGAMSHDPSKAFLSSYGGITRFAQERTRQVVEEGYTPEQDAKLRSVDELLLAAICYLLPTGYSAISAKEVPYADDPAFVVHVPQLWPFQGRYWRPSSRPRDIVKGGALAAAAYDLLAYRYLEFTGSKEDIFTVTDVPEGPTSVEEGGA